MKAPILFLTLVPSLAYAVNVQTLNPPGNSVYQTIESSPNSSEKGRIDFSATLNTVDDPLVELNLEREVRKSIIVDSINTLDLGVGYQILSDLSIHANLPVHAVKRPLLSSKFSLGDARIFSKYRLTSPTDWLSISLIPELKLPTGNTSLFVSDGSLGYGLGLALEHDFGPLVATANVGYRHSDRAEFRDFNYKDLIPVALGAQVPIAKRLAATTEVSTAFGIPFNQNQNSGEWYNGLRYAFNSDLSLAGGISLGNINEAKSTNQRFIIGLHYSPKIDKKPSIVRVKEDQIELDRTIHFEHNSAVLTASGRSLLDEVASKIKQNRKELRKLAIEGHTNELGSDQYNLNLSQKRSESVRRYLIKSGIKSHTLMATGFGKRMPKYGLHSGVSREVRLEADRRVEFKIIH